MAVGHINELATLTRFSYKKIYGCFDGKKILSVLMRWP